MKQSAPPALSRVSVGASVVLVLPSEKVPVISAAVTETAEKQAISAVNSGLGRCSFMFGAVRVVRFW